MAEQYFKIIRTTSPQDRIEDAMRDHEEKLNNYVNYGVALPNSGYEKLANKPLALVKKEVCHTGFSATVNNNTWYLVTQLCCEDEKNEEKE